jgi:hypothetical protein
MARVGLFEYLSCHFFTVCFPEKHLGLALPLRWYSSIWPLAKVFPDETCIFKKVKQSRITGLEWPKGFQEVKVPKFRDDTGWW